MTTPPKARRFHASMAEAVSPDAASVAQPADPAIRLELRKRVTLPPRFGAGPVAAGAVTSDAPGDGDAAMRERFMRTDSVDDGLGDLRAAASDAEAATPDPASDAALQEQLAAIRAENLSERQLRIARRVAGLHQIAVSSDEEAVLRLRERGIDPSHRAALGRILSTEGNRTQANPSRNAPVVVTRAAPPVPGMPTGTELGPPRPDLPTREALTEERRAAEIFQIQRDIARRRRRRMAFLAMRLLAFVLLPTALAGWYYFSFATPLYATYSQYQIQIAAPQTSSTAGSALSGLQANTDAVAVQSYLTSRDAMLRLDQDKGFRAAFQGENIDPVRRLPADATNEETYRLYENSVKISYDPTEGMLDMEVIAPDPQQSQEFSLALIAYAEEQVDRMSARMREDQMTGAAENYADAEVKVLAAQRRVQDLQQTLGVLDPASENSIVMTQVATLEGQMAERRLELGQLLANPRPQQSRVQALQGDIDRLAEMIAQTRQQLTESSDSRSSLAAISGELRIAESDLLTRQELLAGAAALMETARIEANKQVRYLSLSVAPVAPDEATYPKAFQNTLVAFLIFSGIYLMLSLTASILREQVST